MTAAANQPPAQWGRCWSIGNFSRFPSAIYECISISFAIRRSLMNCCNCKRMQLPQTKVHCTTTSFTVSTLFPFMCTPPLEEASPAKSLRLAIKQLFDNSLHFKCKYIIFQRMRQRETERTRKNLWPGDIVEGRGTGVGHCA